MSLKRSLAFCSPANVLLLVIMYLVEVLASVEGGVALSLEVHSERGVPLDAGFPIWGAAAAGNRVVACAVIVRVKTG